MVGKNPKLGIAFAFVSLFILGFMPIISDSRPGDFDALGFATFLSLWQLLFSLPMVVRELASSEKGIFNAELSAGSRRRAITIILLTGVIFGLSTYVYVLAVDKAGPVNAAIAIQAYPLFAILWETLFLNRRKTPLELSFTMLLLIALYYLATEGTWQTSGLSLWFLVALAIPFLWSVAHVIIKEVLDRTPITPAQVTFFRVLISSVFLVGVLIALSGPSVFFADMTDVSFQQFAMLMGLVYYAELIMWFYAVRYIDVSVASSIIVPSPALTMVLAIFFLGEGVQTYQVVTLAVIVLAVYGLLFAGARKRRSQEVEE